MGSKIPSVIVSTFNGEIVKTDSLFAKKTVILFFSTTCPHCKNKITDLNSLYKEFEDKFGMVAFSLDGEKETKEFINELKILFPVYLDNISDAKLQFRVKFVPATFFINQQQLLKSQIGEQSKELLYNQLLKFASITNDSLFTLL